MSQSGGGERGPRAAERRVPFYRVMIACGLAGVLIAVGAVLVDFGTGRHPKVQLPNVPGLPSAPRQPGGTGLPPLPSLPSFPTPSGTGLPSLPSFPSFPVPTS
jgi:hypothetical protein